MSADAEELRQFAQELGEAGNGLRRQVLGVVNKGALNVKNGMQAEMKKSRHFGQIARTINYDVEETPNSVEAEIGPNKHWRAARLANIAYFGSSRGGGGTVDFMKPFNEEKSRFERHIGEALGDVL